MAEEQTPLWDEIKAKVDKILNPHKPEPSPSIQPPPTAKEEHSEGAPIQEQTSTTAPLGDTMPTIKDRYSPEHGEETPVRIIKSESPPAQTWKEPPAVVHQGGAEETPIGGEFRPVGKRKGGTRPSWA